MVLTAFLSQHMHTCQGLQSEMLVT